jgi:hypothetical protein
LPTIFVPRRKSITPAASSLERPHVTKTYRWTWLAVMVGMIAGDPGLHASVTSPGPEGPADFTHVDPATLGVELVSPRKDPVTGFQVGGKNSTDSIKRLPEINGRKIAELERDMRPGAESFKGFLGENESLLDVMAADNKLVVDEWKRTHQELARHMRVLAAVGGKIGRKEFLYHGRLFRVELVMFRGEQPSPFHDRTKTGSDAIVRNLDSGKEIRYSLLVPDMVERYGFYEGQGTEYRVDPRKLLGVIDFVPDKTVP